MDSTHEVTWVQPMREGGRRGGDWRAKFNSTHEEDMGSTHGGTYSSAEHNVSSTSHMRLLPSFASYFDVSVENTIAQTNVEKLMLSSIIC